MKKKFNLSFIRSSLTSEQQTHNLLQNEQVLPISTPSSVPAAVMDSLFLPRVGDAGGDDDDVELKVGELRFL